MPIRHGAKRRSPKPLTVTTACAGPWPRVPGRPPDDRAPFPCRRPAGRTDEGRMSRVLVSLIMLSLLAAGCTTRDDRWRALAREGPLAGWAACMESDGYTAFYDAGYSAFLAAEDGATPISRTEMLLIGLKRCEALAAGTRAADLTPQNR